VKRKIIMPELHVSVMLPYSLELTEGGYPTSLVGEELRVGTSFLQGRAQSGTRMSATFFPDDSADPEVIHQSQTKCSGQFLRRINRLLRWYRSVSRRAEISELTRAQVSPFQFESIGEAASADWNAALKYEVPGPQPAELTVEKKSLAVWSGLASGNDPDVADLFLLDAERSLHQGRFREAVLFSWSTIDSIFNRKYEALVDAVLATDPGEARKLFKDLDFGLKNKMSIGMRVVANRSLYAEPGGLWEKISNSYILHSALIPGRFPGILSMIKQSFEAIGDSIYS